jgi:ribosomal protein L11 methyltransferase
VTDETSEGVTNFLWELGALGVVEEAPAPGAAALRAFFSAAVVADTLGTRVREYLRGLESLGFSGAGEPLVFPLADENWASAWRQHFRPLAVGASLLVAPSWDVPPGNGRLTVIVDPGRAFGTGHHGTTRGCLEALEALVTRARPASAIDLGTGSGILALALARLGVPRVLAVDDDPDAIAAATDNVAHNDVAARVECRLADATALDTPASPLVVANLLTAAHRRLAPDYARHVVAGGRLVLGGILDAEAEEVLGTVRGHGFALLEVRSIEGWTTLVLERR